MGTTLDPSIITGQLQQQAENTGPQQTQGWLGARQLLLQNQQLAAKQAAGQDFQKSINPLTGQVDYGAFNARLAGDPTAAFAAQSASQAGLANQAAQQANLQAEVQTYQARHQALSGIAAGWMQKPNLSLGDVMDGVSDAISQGVIDAQTGAQIMKSYDPSNPQAWAQNEYKALMAQAGQVQKLFPQYSTVNQGGQIGILNTNAGGVGGLASAGTLPTTLSPGEAASPTTITMPNGQQVTEPLGVYAGSNGIPTIKMPGTGAAPGAALPGGAIPGPAPGQTAMNDADTKYMTGLLDQQQAAQQGMAALRNVMAAAPGANTGPLASSVAQISATLNQLGINVGADQATQEQNLTKNAAQLVMASGTKLGVPTDAKFVMAALGSPGSKLTEGANRTIAGEVMGNFSYQNAAANYLQSARSQGLTPGTAQFSQVRQQLNNPMLGTAFQFLYLDPSARARVLGIMSKQDQAQLLDQIKFAYRMDPNLPSLK